MTTPLNVIADRLTKEAGSWSSVEYREHEDFRREDSVPSGGALFTPYRKEIRYVETGLGERLFEAKVVTPRPENDMITIDYCDGKLAASSFKKPHLTDNRDQVVIKRIFATEQNGACCRPFPFASLFVGNQPIGKAINRASSLGTSRNLDRDCDRLLFVNVPLGQFTYSYIFDLDTETSTPLKITSYLGEEARQRDNPTYVWSAEAVERIEGHPIATRSEYVHFDGPPESRQVAFKVKTSVDEVKFDQSYPKEMFWPKITAETKVFDTVKGANQFPKSNSVTVSTSAPPIRADDPGWNWPVAGIGVASGLLLIVASVALIRRRA